MYILIISISQSSQRNYFYLVNIILLFRLNTPIAILPERLRFCPSLPVQRHQMDEDGYYSHGDLRVPDYDTPQPVTNSKENWDTGMVRPTHQQPIVLLLSGTCTFASRTMLQLCSGMSLLLNVFSGVNIAFGIHVCKSNAACHVSRFVSI